MSHDVLFWSALAIGFAGSLHCLGMCGPIVMVLPGTVSERWKFLAGRIVYNVGRVTAYAMLGVVAGAIGQAFTFAGWQQRIGIVVGAVMILSVVAPAVLLSKRAPRNPMTAAIGLVKDRLGRLLAANKTSSLFVIGALNGFLPCGLVYTAMIGSVAAGGVGGSVLYMALFGAGTIPAMLAAAYAANFITVSVRRRLTKLLPVGVAILGALFLLRGLGLGIPFLSPDMEMMRRKVERMTPAAVRDSARVEPPCCAGDSTH
jgi:uncharacterized protein